MNPVDQAQGWVIYQPLIVGLGAVVLATLGNSAVEWVRHYLAERREIVVLRRTLLLELEMISRQLHYGIESLKDLSNDGLITVAQRFPILERACERLGILPWHECDPVGQAVTSVRILTDMLIQHETVARKGETLTLYRIAADQRGFVAENMTRVADTVTSAIVVLRKGKL